MEIFKGKAENVRQVCEFLKEQADIYKQNTGSIPNINCSFKELKNGKVSYSAKFSSQKR